MTKYRWAPEALELLLPPLLAQKADIGFVPAVELRRVAEIAGCSVRTVQRALARGGWAAGTRPRRKLSPSDVQAFFDARGRFSKAYPLAVGSGFDGSRSTYERGIRTELTPAERDYARRGVAGRRAREVHLRQEVAHKNDEWQIDVKELDVWVFPNRSQTKVRPQMIVLIDSYTRGIPGYYLGTTHTAAEVLAALRHGFLPDSELGPLYGLPNTLRADNGREFLSDAMLEALGMLAIAPVFTTPYSPHLKGKVERVHRTITDELVAGLHFSIHSPRRADKLYYQPNLPAMTLEELRDILRNFIVEYNNKRAHGALGGATPAEAWNRDPAPVREAPDELNWMLQTTVQRTVNKDGLHLENRIFVAPELNGLVGEQVQVRYKPDDLRSIAVYRDGSFLATALPQASLTVEERLALRNRRREDRKRSSEQMRKASARRRLELAPSPGRPGRGSFPSQPRAPREPTAAARKLLGLDTQPREEDR